MRRSWILCCLGLVVACSSAVPAPTAAPSAPVTTDPVEPHAPLPTTPKSLPDTPPGKLARSWLAAHNAGDEVSLAQWIEDTYAPALLDHVDVGEHAAFYRSIVEDFGELSPMPVAVTESSARRLVVHLRPTGVLEPDPTTTLVVEVEVDPEDSGHLVRGLGLGALICEDKKP